MSRLEDASPHDDAPDAAPSGPVAEPGSGPGAIADLATLSIAGITPRRVGGLVAGLLAAWIVIMFVRQVNEVAAASARVDELGIANAHARTLVSALEREKDQIARQRYVEQQARAYGLGTPREIAFTLDPDAPPLPDDAPGSARVRLGAPAASEPLERWLTVLFGPSD